MTSLYAKPQDTLRSSSSHNSAVDSIKAKSIRTNVMECNTLVTDELIDRDGNTIVETDYILLSETASQPAPGQNQSRLWVRSDTPTRAIFTSQSGLDIALEPDLATVLMTSGNGENLSFINIGQVAFTAGVQLSEQTDAVAISTSSSEVVVGHGTQSSAVGNTLLGNSLSSNVNASVVLGYNCTVEALAPSSNNEGTVCIGLNNTTTGGECVVIGKNIVNASNNQNSYPNMLIGSNISVPLGADSCICIGNDPALPQSSSSDFISIGNESTAAATAINNIVAIGHETLVTNSDDIVIGHEAQSSGGSQPNVVIGNKAKSFCDTSVSIGYGAICAGLADNVAIGANALSNGVNVIAIGYNARSVGEYSMVIGANSVSEFDWCYVVGASIASRRNYEFVTRPRRTIGGPGLVLNGATTSGTVFTYPTVSGDVLHLDGTIIGERTDALGSYLAVLERYNFRNKNGILTKSTAMGTLSQSQTDAGTGVSVSVGVSGVNIVISAVRTAGSWHLAPAIRLHATPLE